MVGEVSVVKEFMSKKAVQIFGKEYELESMERILGGAQKYTYLAKCTNGFKFVIYQWDKSTTYFKNNDERAVFCSNSAKLFQRNNELMRNQGVLTPKLFYINLSRSECEYEYAFVEYINGHDMDYIMENDNQYAKLYVQVEAKAIECAKKLEVRDEYTFIHGELGPNHVIVDKNNNAYLIDIEGAKFYDVEEELSFLDIRFNKILEKSDGVIDEQRKYFYHIRHCFGNLQGAVELKQKGYYDINDVNEMIEFFHKQMVKIM